MTYLWVGIGGALGSIARYSCASLAVRWFGPAFPWGTLFVNVTGSFVIGLLASLVSAHGRAAVTGDMRAFLLVGVLGGFTTFSSFSLDTLNAARTGAWLTAGANVLSSVLLCLTAVWLGYLAAGALSR